MDAIELLLVIVGNGFFVVLLCGIARRAKMSHTLKNYQNVNRTILRVVVPVSVVLSIIGAFIRYFLHPEDRKAFFVEFFVLPIVAVPLFILFCRFIWNLLQQVIINCIVKRDFKSNIEYDRKTKENLIRIVKK